MTVGSTHQVCARAFLQTRNIITNKMTVFTSGPASDDSCFFQVWMKNSVYEEKMKNF